MTTNKLSKSENSKKEIVYAPMNGTAIPLYGINDHVFSQEILGKGAAIEPSDGKVYSPFDGSITMVFHTKHAITIESDTGVEVLIHVGLNTVKLNGTYFKVYKETGDKVKAGDLLAEVELEAVKSEGYRTTTPVIISNTDQYHDIRLANKGKISTKDALMEITLK